MKYGLKENIIKKIINVFEQYPDVSEVILYGSRAKDDYRHGSDIDFTIKGNLNRSTLNKIEMQLDDLLLPYTFDISLFNQIDNVDLIDHIKRVGKIIYKKDKAGILNR